MTPFFIPVIAFLLRRQYGKAMKIIAHRGASHTAPENTLASFRLGLSQGADGIELDIRLSLDGQIVAIHDADTGRTADKSCLICDTAYNVICTLDAGSWKCDEYKCERIPLLSEVLDMLPPGREIYIEIKCGDTVIKPLAELLSKHGGLAQRAVIFGFDYDVLCKACAALPAFRCLWIGEFGYNIEEGADMYDRALRMVEEGGFSGFSTKSDRHHVAEMKKRLGGKILNVWTVDSADDAKFYKELGISSLTTNRPDLIIKNI